ncbi:hypothetical protein H0266_08340 [Halobacillus locisalis]|uniref:Uracil DNA glycosylase superfamily protein n=1 Tax=Halobacillus locisalis TaxID=220753 RepID=A0A838CSU6_9BACI|nr:hypothetical protein [Halobacillus locisalis]MBA2174899.1 hypothetical protein [Halobacillus locisalis]
MEDAIPLLKRAVQYQIELSHTPFREEFIDGAVPMLWQGERQAGNIVTIGTNPTAKEFLTTDLTIAKDGQSQPFTDAGEHALEHYLKNDHKLKQTIDYYDTYFKRDTTYRQWFGKPNGAKLEGFLNGMGASFYPTNSYTSAVHVDYFPLATRRQMGKIKGKDTLLDATETRDLLTRTLDFLQPDLVVVLGLEHCGRFRDLSGCKVESVEGYPSARYQIGCYQRLGVPLIGLHFKPSEVFLGLGGGADENGRNHGTYAGEEALRFMGESIAASENL